MTFKQLAHAFYAINQESSRLKITQLLADVFIAASAHEARHISYLALGTLRAPFESNQFNYAEKNSIKVLSALLGQEREVFAAQVKQAGDIGLAILGTSWPYEDAGLSIEELYNYLAQLQAITGTGAQEEKSVLLSSLLKQVDALSASFIMRIIMGTMRLGFSDMTLIDSLSWMLVGNKSLHGAIEDAYNICADIGLITQSLKQQGIAGLVNIKPQLGIPIRPAAAERAPDAEAIIERLGTCVAQPKLDGFRLQIHIDKTDIEPQLWFFSRNLLNMSFMFPDLVKALKDLPVTTLIVEGEAIVYDESTQSFVPFQETVKRKRKHDIEELAQSMPLKLFLFDILYLNNTIVLSKSHEERRALLLDIFKKYPVETVQVIEERYCLTAKDLNSYLNEEITKGLEGLVVKRPDAPYRPGKRNFNWIKLKRHQEGHLDDTLDVVVLGYYAGRGKRADFGIGAFLVGVYNKEKDRFETVAKIGTGLSDEQWLELKARCDAQRIPEQPHNVVCSPELIPDVWVTPVIVVIVLADEITRSPLHTAGQNGEHVGLALRFPRFMGYSIDKTPEQATSVTELQELYTLQFN